MFEYRGMTPASATLEYDAAFDGTDTAVSGVAAVSDLPYDSPSQRLRITELRGRINSMQATKLDARLIPTHPAIAELLPGGGLRQGSMYSLQNSATLLLALLAGPSAAGSWCGVVGVPEFGIEAAASFGIDLERLVLVPHPGDQWLAVTAAIADVMTVIVTKPPRQVSGASLSRLSARLRQRGSTLIVLTNDAVRAWPQTEAMLSLSESTWSGIGEGFGHLTARQVTVTVSTRLGGRPRSARMWLPDPQLEFARVRDVPTASVTTEPYLRAL